MVPVASRMARWWPWDACSGGIPAGGAPKTGTTTASVSSSDITVPNSVILRICLPKQQATRRYNPIDLNKSSNRSEHRKESHHDPPIENLRNFRTQQGSVS